MSARQLDLMVGILAVLLCAVGVQRWRRAIPAADVPIDTPPPVASLAGTVSDDTLTEAENALVDNDPFRISNRPANVRYRGASGVGAANLTAAPRPALRVDAIVGGPPWQAILSGVPGQPGGVIVMAGATLGALRIRSISSDTIVVQGTDTTWHLTLFRGAQ